MICKNCNKEFIPTKGLVHYCSIKCVHARKLSEESKDKIRRKLVGRKYSKERIASALLKQRLSYEKRLLEVDFSSLKWDRINKRIILEQEKKCNKCGLSEWMGLPIALELEHKDGNHQNNSHDNLEALCPNCHSQTKTWRGRNMAGRKYISRISDELLMDKLIEHNFNFRQTLLSLGLAAKGGNYVRCHKLTKVLTSN